MTNYFKKLPIGIENFKELREDNFYYVDKTQLIEKLLQNWGKANLFTRPRRFGKSLTMSMLKHFLKLGVIHLFLMDCIFLKIKNYVSNIWESFLLFLLA